MFKRVLMLCLAAAVLTVGFSKANAADKLKIAVAGPHSGDLASYGIPATRAAALVAEEVNAKGGVMGMTVELVNEDEQCKPELATNVATKILSEDISFVIGHVCSGATKAAMPIYTENDVLVISPSATNPDLTKSGDYPNFFRTIAPDDAQAQLQVDFLLTNLGAKKVAVLHDKGDYGKGLAEFAKGFLEKSGKAEVVLFEGVTPGAVDYSAVVQKVKESGADAVVYGGYHPEASKIVTQMRKEGMKQPFISGDGVKDDTFIKVAGEFSEGVFASGPKDISANPLYAVAEKAHKDKYGEEPGAFYYQAYAAMQALLNAIEKTGTTEYEKVASALRTEKVETPLGVISFDERGDAIGAGFSVYQVVNGQFVVVE